MRTHIYYTALFLINNLVMLYIGSVMQIHIDNLADAYCYEGRVVMDIGG